MRMQPNARFCIEPCVTAPAAAPCVRRAFVPSQRLLRRPVGGDLEQQRAVVADFLDRRQRRRPVDGALERHQVVVGPAAIVVHVRRDQVLRHGFDGVDEIAVHVRMAEIEADADRRSSSSTSSTKWTSEPARDSSFGITSTASRTPSGSASRCSSSMLRRAPSRLLSPGAGSASAAARDARPAR